MELLTKLHTASVVKHAQFNALAMPLLLTRQAKSLSAKISAFIAAIALNSQKAKVALRQNHYQPQEGQVWTLKE